MFTFTDALILAAEAHRNQKDDGGVDYIKHPLYLYHKLKMKGFSNEIQMAAILHDAIEDGNVTFEKLKQVGCPESVIDALELLTHTKNEIFIREREQFHKKNKVDSKEAYRLAKDEEYFKYIENVAKNDIARVVKIEDLRHNSDIRRIPHSMESGHIGRRITKYAKALKMLTGGKVGYV